MSRNVLISVGSIPEDAWYPSESGDDDRVRESVDARILGAVAEIEQATGREFPIHAADVGRGASGFGAVLEVVEVIAVAGSAFAAVGQISRFVKWTYNTIAAATGYRPMISLGAAEHLAKADLIDRVGSTPELVGSGDVNSNSPDVAFTGGDTFWIVLATESELHSYHVSAYGETFYVGTSPLIRNHMDPSPPYWAGGDAADD